MTSPSQTSPSKEMVSISFLLELFIWANVSFLAIDIYVAHSVNEFKYWPEWLPFGFSIIAAIVLIPGLLTYKEKNNKIDILRICVGLISIVMGIAGLIYHLRSHFFLNTTLHSLVYSAPFAAPLAYTGLGLLLLMNQLEPRHTHKWALWVLLLASGGFVGNLALSLADHAQNGFFFSTEWIPVVSASFGLIFLLWPCFESYSQNYLKIAAIVMFVQIIVGLLGFILHIWDTKLFQGSIDWDNIVHGPPIFAPLLFVDLAILGLLGLYAAHQNR